MRKLIYTAAVAFVTMSALGSASDARAPREKKLNNVRIRKHKSDDLIWHNQGELW